jgi:hypothetical protein
MASRYSNGATTTVPAFINAFIRKPEELGIEITKRCRAP